MEITIYVLIFLMGLMFGSFFSLAIYRIPLGKNITHERSFCPSCNHKLGFFDMIPLLSYIFLRGKCRYCSKKIGLRYILLELASGLIFLLFAISLNINFLIIEQKKLVYLIIGILYFSGIMLIAGIDKEKRIISKQVLVYGMIVLFTYILYLYILEKINVYRYAIYLVLMCLLIMLNIMLLKKKVKENYTINILLLCVYIALFSQEEIFIYTILFTLVFVLLKSLICELKSKKNQNSNENKVLPIGLYLCSVNILLTIIQNFIIYRS